ncbi:MAG TPA: YlxR family protein [bacterium]|nr:YlxR family protein [bacterium]
MPKVRKIPQRQCVACGQMRGKRDLVRVVRTPAGEVRVDATGRLSGRGAYVCPDAACVERALREGRLEGALERPISAEVAQGLQEALTRPAPARAPVVRRITLRQLKESQAGAGGSDWRDRREGA